MNNDQENPAEDPLRLDPGDLEATQINALLRDVKSSDMHKISMILAAAGRQSSAEGNESSARGYRVLAAISHFHFHVSDPAQPLSARILSLHKQTASQSYFRGARNNLLATFVPSIEHPALRARIADVAWFNDRSLRDVSDIAIQAYCDLVSGRINGRFEPPFPNANIAALDLVDFVHRALQISMLRSNGELIPDHVMQTFLFLYNHAKQNNSLVAFEMLARLGWSHKIFSIESVANDAYNLAEAMPSDTFTPLEKKIWFLAAWAYGKSGDLERKNACQLKSVEATLRERDKASSAFLKATLQERPSMNYGSIVFLKTA